MDEFEMDEFEVKAPQDAILDLPQERITGDVLKGRGPRRGNLERLLRYWRPIMRKEGGFRRCKVILADHPELYPLNNICAWLHHETTGLWPNEGCHHPGMKNCKRKLKKVFNGSKWNDKDWDSMMNRRFKPQGKSLPFDDEMFFSDSWHTKTAIIVIPGENHVVTLDDMAHAMRVLKDFCEMESDFVEFLRNNDNWDMLGEDGMGNMMKSLVPLDEDCGCDK